MKNLLIFLLMIMSSFLYAQSSGANAGLYDKCKLSEGNKIWWEKVKSETDNIKIINSIKGKIISDTIYKRYIPKVKIRDQISISPEYIDENGNLCGGKILFVISYRKRKIQIINHLESSSQINLINEISPENTKIVLIPADEGSAALYGSRGAEGVVIIRTKSKILKKKIEKPDEIKRLDN